MFAVAGPSSPSPRSPESPDRDPDGAAAELATPDRSPAAAPLDEGALRAPLRHQADLGLSGEERIGPRVAHRKVSPAAREPQPEAAVEEGRRGRDPRAHASL